MKKILGIASLLFVVCIVTAVLAQQSDGSNTFLTAYNLENLAQRLGMFGILSIAAPQTPPTYRVPSYCPLSFSPKPISYPIPTGEILSPALLITSR